MPNRNFIEVQLQNSNKYDAWRYGAGGHLYNEKIEVPADVAIIRGHPKGQPPKRLIPQALQFSIDGYTKKSIIKWLKENKVKYDKIIHAQKGEVLKYKSHILFEAFNSLRKELNQAVTAKFGRHSYVSDFSDKEVIIGYTSESPEGSSYQTDKYTKVGYTFKNGVITFAGTPKEVEKKTVYEGIEIDGGTWGNLRCFEVQLKKIAESKE